MSQVVLHSIHPAEATDAQWRRIATLSGVVSFIQLVLVLIPIIVFAIAGVGEPTTAEEYFTVLQNDRLVGILRLDFATLLLICLISVMPFGIYAALRHTHGPYALLAGVLIVVGVLLALANHSALSMILLSDKYAAATTAAERAQLLAAGEAIIASDMWRSTAGFLAGIFMQGGFAFISIVMLRSRHFSRWTAYTGLAANGLDWIHVFVGLFATSLANTLLYIGGVFYLAWFPLLGRDLLRFGRGLVEE